MARNVIVDDGRGRYVQNITVGPHVLLADEPTASLDDESAENLARLLVEQHRQRLTIVVASHDPQIIEAVPALARETGRGVDDFEYQMLYGIRDA